MAKIKINHGEYKPKICTPQEKKRLHEGMIIFRQMLKNDEQERRQRGLGLPKYWDGIIIRGQAN